MKFKIQNLLFFSFLFSFFILTSAANAAEIYFGVQNSSVGVGSIVEVGVLLRTEGANVNAVEGKILFPRELVTLKEVREGNSLVNLWVKKPEAQEAGSLFFSGLVPSGFSGEDGYLFSLFFETTQEGEVRIETDSEQVLLADGKGSKAIIKKAPLVFDIEGEAQAVNELAPLEDSTLPESFSPQVSREADIFGGKWFLVFVAQDKGFGVSHYEVQEGAGAWKKASSPYLLEDQSLRSSISVKAVDKAGNERIEILEPQNPARWYQSLFVWFIIIGVVCLFGLAARLWRKQMQKSK